MATTTTTTIDNNNFNDPAEQEVAQRRQPTRQKEAASVVPERLVEQTQLEPTIPRFLQGADLHCVVRPEVVLNNLDLLKTTGATLLVILEKAERGDVTVGQQNQRLSGHKPFELVVG